MISITSLKKQYKLETVLDINSLDISRGETVGLVGNNGAGKTTLFRLILDLIPATEGSVTIDEKNVKDHENWKNYVGAYLDEHMLLGFLTPDEYFETLRKINGLSKRDLNIHLKKFETLFNDEILSGKKYIRDLSKGNIKKVGIASAMLGLKELILLDEPFENLDPTSQNRLKSTLRREQKENNSTFFISSHDLTHVTDICERIIILEKGVIKKDLKEEQHQMTSALNEYFGV